MIEPLYYGITVPPAHSYTCSLHSRLYLVTGATFVIRCELHNKTEHFLQLLSSNIGSHLGCIVKIYFTYFIIALNE